MLNFGFQFGKMGGGTPPLLQGDYIWYSLNPDTGFLAEPVRKINDEGSTAHILPVGGRDNDTSRNKKTS